MKQLFFLVVLVTVGAFGLSAQTKPATTPKKTTTTTAKPAPAPAPAAAPVKPENAGPKMVFEAETIDYGKIKKGGEPVRIFKFKNAGTEPLMILSARGSCGCTVPTYPEKAIQPGETAEIKVRYDTQRLGPFNKQVTITTNEKDGTKMLTIKGEVFEAEEQPGVPAKPGSGVFNN